MPNQHTNSVGNRIVTEHVKKYPNMPARTGARKVFTENPGVFTNVEAVRNAIKMRHGVHGESNRKIAIVPREPRKAGEDWRKFLPTPKRTIDLPWGPVKIPGAVRALILSDIHIPFYDQQAIELAIEYGIERDADFVLLNGDIVDHFALSKWQKDPRLKDFPGEVHAGRDLLHSIRLAFPKAQIYWKLGNHEERYEAYMISQAPEFLGVEAFEWSSVFGLDRERVHLVEDKRPIILGKLNVVHGHEWRCGAYDPVNPARSFFTKSVGVHVLGGDRHRTSQHSENNLEQNVVSAWSAGCLCELHPKWMPINKWNHGFAFVTVDEKGAFQVENKRIIDGAIW